MEARCDVRSQHKLPGMNEILNTTTVEYIGLERAKRIIESLLADGTLIAYGPYISDHNIDVM
jgi:hypothetical protein